MRDPAILSLRSLLRCKKEGLRRILELLLWPSSCIELLYFVAHIFYLFLGEFWVDWKAKNLFCMPLCDREVSLLMPKELVCLLQVQRNRIINLCGNSSIIKECREGISILCPYRVYIIDVLISFPLFWNLHSRDF